MNAGTLFCTARARFEAARDLSAGGGSGLHGHGFDLRVCVEASHCGAAFAGDEIDALERRLHQAIAPLDGSLLNDRLPAPTDAALLHHLHAALALREPALLRLDATPLSGALLSSGRALRWRHDSFHAAHVLPHVAPGHKCGRLHGHGFGVRLTYAGALQQDHRAIDPHWAALRAHLHLACLNELPGLDNPTSEHIAAWIWRALKPVQPSLAAVAVLETPTCGALFDGREHAIWKTLSFDSAVRLMHAPPGDARYGAHGHTFTLRLQLRGPLVADSGWVMDFGELKSAIAPLIDALDHRPLHMAPGIADSSTPALLRHLVDRLQPDLPLLERVDLEQAPGSGALWRRDGMPPAAQF